jgi:hypothetical protein
MKRREAGIRVVPEDVPNPGQRFGHYNGLASHPYAAFWKLWISRIQLVSGFHLRQIWATILRSPSASFGSVNQARHFQARDVAP